MHYSDIKQMAREMRKNPTPAEAFMWEKVRKRQLNGYKFNRQFILRINHFVTSDRYFIVDFYNNEHKLIIEVDGKIHLQQFEQDKARDQLFLKAGFHVLRFKNEQVLNRWNWVEQRILLSIEQNKKW